MPVDGERVFAWQPRAASPGAPPMKLFNSLTGRKETFVPADPSRPTMYVCGPTVYNYAHIGNARAAVVFDLLQRVLKHRFGDVLYVRNVTDIDDKIIKAAAERGLGTEAIAAEFTRAYHEDMDALNVLRPSVEPFATGHIPHMVAMIAALIAKGHAYEAAGHVLFHVPSFPGYGRLSRRSRDEMIDGARVEVAPYKRDPADFVLWKPSTPDQPGWDSPYGRGRPGWHIECSAMVEAHLGVTIDIHGGGQDLKFPHHENELAQSVCAHGGAPLARFWLHNGFLDIDQEKMSKSLGNVLPGARPAARVGRRSQSGRGDPLCPAQCPLSQAAQLVDRHARPCQAGAHPPLPDASRPARAGAGRRSAGAPGKRAGSA